MSVTSKSTSPTVRATIERRKRFRAALALAGMDAGDFAEAVDVTEGHLSLVVHGKRESQKLVAEIDAFIAKYLPSEAA